MLFLALALSAPHSLDVSYADLVRDVWDLRCLATYPNPPYLTRQASSYDPASKSPGNDDWFANKDWGNFIRDEQTEGRKEHVLADLKGPGTIVRYWSPNPAGVTRIYVDGSTKPVIEAKTADLLGGSLPPFGPPVGQSTANGWTLYCPIPYQRSIKVTVDDTDKDAGSRMYYQIQYRTYAPDVTLEPFSIDRVKSAGLVGRFGTAPRLVRSVVRANKVLKAGEQNEVALKGPGIVTQLTATVPVERDKDWTGPAAIQNVLRAVRVKATFDGEECIDVPLGDLFCSTAGIDPLNSMPATVEADGTMTLRLPMPYREGAKITFINEGRATVDLKVAASVEPYAWTADSMHFKAQWLCYQGGTRPMRDLNFLSAMGQGVYVGCNVSISNPVSGWWGEGDEKIYLDGETFPSTFGTGTEDFFGYGWSSPTLFQHPYHYQTRCDGPGTKGHSCIGRWQILDRMPFDSSFQFDMELWHWVDCQMQYGRTAFWYAKPGGSGPHSDDAAKFPLPFIEGAVRVKNAIEGEEAVVSSKSGGETEIQGFDGLSNGNQLWWRDAKVGDSLTLMLSVAGPGRYHAFGRFCCATDYGIHAITIGTESTVIDFYDKLGWKTLDLGIVDVKPGMAQVPMNVRVVGANPKAEPRHMFGLDYVLLVKD